MSEIDGAISRLTIDLEAIQRNYRRLKAELGPETDCAAVVKADAYGLGARHVAPALAAAGVRRFFVAQIEEGIALRSLLPNAELFVLNGLQPGLEAEFERHELIPVLNSLLEIELWANRARSLGRALPAAIHLDTGMSRLGMPRGEIERLIEEPHRLDGIRLLLVMSHLACSDEPEHEANQRQLGLFQRCLPRLPAVPASLANSSGIFLGPDYRFQLVRPGAALYGVNPVRNRSNPMEQVIVVEGKILQVRDVDRGTTVGYGATHRIERAHARLATVGVGYADGYLRSASGRGLAYLGNRRVRVVGRISMDLITIDVSEATQEETQPGDWVELIGPHLPVDEVADRAGTIGYEVLTSLGRRYRRRYVTSAG
ncbi:MAG TPA: alanine racemase [Alphaproteobacteria bacterium]|nr:alanine racemase [Alphaproteobacteria bacterium]